VAAVGNTSLTLADVVKRKDPDGKFSQIANLLAQQNEILDDLPWVEGNLENGHQVTVQTSLPTVGTRRANAGAATSKSTTAQSTFTCAHLEGFSDVDQMIVDRAGGGESSAQLRYQEDTAYVEAINQKLSQLLIYGNEATSPDEFTGLAARYATAASTDAHINSMINGGGAGSDNTSVWLVGWSPQTIFGIYPKGAVGGLDQKDLGLQVKHDSSSNPFYVYRSQIMWDCGICIKDWRYAIRICNIDKSNLVGESSNTDLIKTVVRATERIPNLSACTPVIYCSRTVREMWRIQTINKVASSTLSFENIAGKRVMMFDGIPVRIIDQLTASEAAISFS
jgi:hypothetical protein